MAVIGRSELLIRQRLSALSRALPGARAGEVPAIHQARVATRRLREALPLVARGSAGRKLARTVRGKGLPSIERRADRWFVNFTHDEIRQLMDELHGMAHAELVSETLVVR